MASIEVETRTEEGALRRYPGSDSASAGNILWDMLPFILSSCLVSIAQGVASEPVPQVVGTAATGYASSLPFL